MKLGTIAYWDQGKVFLSRWDIFIFCFTEKKGGPLFFKIQNLGMWGMNSGVKANEKHDGGNNKFLGSSGDPLLTPFLEFRIYACGVCTVGLRLTRNMMVLMKTFYEHQVPPY